MAKIAKACALMIAGPYGKSLRALVLLFLWQGSTHAMDVTIAWEANTEAELAGYRVYYDTDTGPPYSPDQSDYAAGYSVDGGQTWTDVTGTPPITVGPNVTMISLKGLSNNRERRLLLRTFSAFAVDLILTETNPFWPFGGRHADERDSELHGNIGEKKVPDHYSRAPFDPGGDGLFPSGSQSL
jgi:hypothetical protein